MTGTLPHDQIEELLPAAALEILEGDELVAVTQHLGECAGCVRLLDSYREAVATLATTLPEMPLHPARSARLRARLLTRAAGNPSAPAGAAARSRHIRTTAGRWGGWAVAAGLAGLLLVHHAIHRPVAYGWLVAGGVILLALALGVYIRVQRARLSLLEEQLSAVSATGRTKGRAASPDSHQEPGSSGDSGTPGS